ncbi:hypothetical protein QBC39DRAFT_62517 [Podospora conica]|nr:hypothetical protein QBC39DRAFT_62517 [Schizothecium conicum]
MEWKVWCWIWGIGPVRFPGVSCAELQSFASVGLGVLVLLAHAPSKRTEWHLNPGGRVPLYPRVPGRADRLQSILSRMGLGLVTVQRRVQFTAEQSMYLSDHEQSTFYGAMYPSFLFPLPFPFPFPRLCPGTGAAPRHQECSPGGMRGERARYRAGTQRLQEKTSRLAGWLRTGMEEEVEVEEMDA